MNTINNIIDNPIELKKLSNNELDEVLLDEKYNKANLRQLVRKCLRELSGSVELSNHYKSEYEDYKSKYENLLNSLQHTINKEQESD